MTLLLQQFNLRVSSAMNGRDGIKLVQNRLDRIDLKMFRLILCDYGMTEMNGITCMKAIRSLILKQGELEGPESVKMPYICCVTAYQ